MMWWGASDWLGWWLLFGGFWMLLFWGVVIGVVIWSIRYLTRRETRDLEEGGPLEIARRRYARGEITREEFEEIEGTLRSGAR